MMEIKAECYLGHTLKTVPWIDADGNLRLLVASCKTCSDMQDEDIEEIIENVRS
jgi:hypothetical protein